MAGFLTPLDVEFIDGHNWSLTRALQYDLDRPDGPEMVLVPAGFVTDFASIPRVLWSIFPPAGPWGKPAVIHDWLYQKGTLYTALRPPFVMRPVRRAEADRILFQAMGVVGVGLVTRVIIWLGVRLGGWVPWGAYRGAEGPHTPNVSEE